MSRRENHWYLAGAVLEALRRARRPRAWTIAAAVVVGAALVPGILTGALDPLVRHAASPAFVWVFAGSLGVVALATGAAVGLARRAGARKAYLTALAEPTPEPLLAVVERSARLMRRLPDGDALAAQARAFAWALYGRGPEAFRAISEVSWGARAPLIHAVGLSAEAVTEALCRRDAPRALELAQRARALASLSARLPGAAQTARYHETCVGLCEVLAGVETPEGVARLEESAEDPRFPPLQLVAAYALAIARERSGDGERAARLRAFLRATAPHCAPLQATAPATFAARSGAPAPGSPEATPPLPSAVELPVGTPVAAAVKRRLLAGAARVVGVWALLLAMFVALWWLFSARP